MAISPYDESWPGIEASRDYGYEIIVPRPITLELIEQGFEEVMMTPRQSVVMIPASWSITEIGPLPPGWKCVDGKLRKV